MAIYSFRMGERVSRGAGQSAVKAASYQAREKIRDERTGYLYNHSPKERAELASSIAAASAYMARGARYADGRLDALFVGLYAPQEAPDWCRGRENIGIFWNRAELAERRQDAHIAERFILALPHELTVQQNVWLLQDYIKEAFTRQGRVVQVAIHAPEHGDGRNIHAHLLVSTRGVDANGFKATKAAEQKERHLYRRQYVQDLRERWTETVNRHLARHGHEARIDHRTLKEQGIDRAPTIHLGPGDSRRERHGERSTAGEINREIAARHAEREAGREIDPSTNAQEEPLAKRARPVEPAREAEIIDLDAWRRELEQEAQRSISVANTSPAPASLATQKNTQTHEAAPASEAPPPALTASDSPQRGRARQQDNDPGPRVGARGMLFGRAGKMLRSAFETALDWIAPVVTDPHQQPVPQQPPPPLQRGPEKPEAQKPLSAHERTEMRRQRREREEGRDGEQYSPLYSRFQAEREVAYQTRRAAEQDVRERFAAYAQEARNFYDRQFDETRVAGLPGPVTGEAMRMLSAMRRGDRGTAIRLEREAIAEVRRTHALPSWGEFLEREVAKGDQGAARAFERHKAREAERNRDRGDEGLGIEP